MVFSDFQVFIIGVIIMYLVLLLLDILLKKLFLTKYLHFIRNTGIRIQLFQLRWSSSKLNRSLQRFGSWHPNLQNTWFSVGTWVTVFSIPIAIYFMCQSTYALFVNLNLPKSMKMKPFLEPSVPGISFPLSEIIYYVSALFTCSLFHEFGHAISAVREDLRITSVGIVFILIVPVAYVKIEGTEGIPVKKQLRIFCAGVWHNIALTFISLAFIYFLPFVLYPFYSHGEGVNVISIRQDSMLLGTKGLYPGDVINSINRCAVYDSNTLSRCIQRVAKKASSGYCLTAEYVQINDQSASVQQLATGGIECCKNGTDSELCFEYLDSFDDPVEIRQHTCLTVRNIVKSKAPICTIALDCNKSHCFRPSLANATRIVEIERKYGDVVLYIGHPLAIYYGITTSNYVSKLGFSSSLPDIVTKYFEFLIMFSGALAVINVLPCFYFDGQHIIRMLIHLSLNKNVYKTIRLASAIAVTIVGTILLVIYLTVVFLTLCKQ